MHATVSTSVDDLEPGDEYLWGEVGTTSRTVRTVLGVIQRAPRGILLEVRKPDGNVTRSLLGGRVDVLTDTRTGRKMRDRNGYDGPMTACELARVRTDDGTRGVLVGHHPAGHAILAVRNPFQGFDGPKTTFVTVRADAIEAA